MKRIRKATGLFFYGLYLSSLIGGIAYLFLLVERTLSDRILAPIAENSVRRIPYLIVMALIGGVLVGMCRKKWSNLPTTARETITELKTTKTVNYQPIFRHFFVAVLILIFGAGVGPEASLLSAIVSLSVWQADKMRYLYFQRATLKNLPLFEKLKRLINPFRYRQTYNEELATKENKRRVKVIFNNVFIVNGLVIFFMLSKLTKQPSIFSRIGVSNWNGADLWWFLPLVLFGGVFAAIYHWFEQFCQRRFAFWQDKPIAKALVGSLSIIVIGSFMPYLLSSGQMAMGQVASFSQGKSLFYLSMLAIIKLIFLQVCLKTGWIGGDIFPILFSGMLQGFAMTYLLPQVDPIFVVAVVSTSITIGILKTPWIGLFVLPFFPANITPILFVLMALYLVGNKVRQSAKLMRA